MEMEKEEEQYLKEIREEARLRERLSSREITFLRRKLELLVRDPIGIELAKEAEKLELPIDEWPENVQKLMARLEEKWRAILSFTCNQKYHYKLAGWDYYDPIDPKGEKPFVIGMGHIEDGIHMPIDRKIRAINFYRLDASRGRKKAHSFLHGIIGQDRLANDDRLFVEIDLDLLDLADAKYIKKEVWNITKYFLQKRKDEGKTPTNMDNPNELLFLVHSRDTTFQNYLRWYDIHTETQLSLRAIAEIEHIRKGSILNAEELLNKYIQRQTNST